MIRIAAIAALAGGFLLAPVETAHAEWPNDQLSYRGYKRDLYWRQFHCGGRYRPEGCEAYRWRRWQSQRRPANPDNAFCHERITRTGDQAQSREAAEGRALLAWQGEVRFKFGERYLDFGHARDARIECSPSSVADTVGGKIQDKLLGISHFRCELSARPCRAQPRKVDNRGDD